MEESKLIFITGGVRSGKSNFAEKQARELAVHSGGALHYIACGRRSDKEMEERIGRHRQDREKSLIPWQTWEFPRNIGRVQSMVDQNSIVLLDCLTTLLDNELFLPERPLEEAFLREVFNRIICDVERIRKQVGCLIIVSNEVIQEPIFHDPVLHLYGKMLGQLHQAIVRMSDEAYLVESGIPLRMKE